MFTWAAPRDMVNWYIKTTDSCRAHPPYSFTYNPALMRASHTNAARRTLSRVTLRAIGSRWAPYGYKFGAFSSPNLRCTGAAASTRAAASR